MSFVPPTLPSSAESARAADPAEIDALAERLCNVRANAQDNELRSWHYLMKAGLGAESWRAVAREAWRLGARVEALRDEWRRRAEGNEARASLPPADPRLVNFGVGVSGPRVSDTWTCERCQRAPRGNDHVCAILPAPSQQEKDLADTRHWLQDARASLERVTAELAHAREHALACSKNSTETEREAQGLREAVERVTQERDAAREELALARQMSRDTTSQLHDHYSGLLGNSAAELADAARRAETAERALREIRGFDDTWSHRGHEPSEVGHECRMCWIMKTVDRALSAPAVAGTPQTETP